MRASYIRGEGKALFKSPTGGVVEWLMALVLKTSDVRASVGSNPTPSAQKSQGKSLAEKKMRKHVRQIVLTIYTFI